MSIEAIDNVWKNSRQKSGPLIVLLAIADYINVEGEAFPAMSTLAKKARMTKRNAQRCVHALVKARELEVHQNQGRRGSNIYRILLCGTPSKKGGTHVVGDSGVAKGMSSASPTRDANVAQSVNEPKKEPTPIVPIGDDVEFWVRICFDCFRQPYRVLRGRVLYKLTRDLRSLNKEHANSLLEFYRSEEPNSRQPPFNSRRHSPERLASDLPRQLALAVQEFPPPEPPKPPKQYPFTLEKLHEHLRETHGNCRLPRSLAELETDYWPDMLPEILEAMRIKNEKGG